MFSHIIIQRFSQKRSDNFSLFLAGFPQGLENMENREQNNGQGILGQKLGKSQGIFFILGQSRGIFFPEWLNAAISITWTSMVKLNQYMLHITHFYGALW